MNELKGKSLSTISTDKITFSYEDELIIDSISFNVKKNSVVGIIGENGAGKSTLISLLIGLNIPDSGEIFLNNVLVEKKNIKEIRKIAGYVFQNPDDQLFMPSVFDDVAFGLRNMGLSERQVLSSTENILSQMGILHLKNRPPHRLSGGEKRVVAMCTACVMNPDILLLDEPTSFLDHKHRRNVINILKNVEQTVMLTTHDLDMVIDICDTVIILHKGKLLKIGETLSVLSDYNTMKVANLDIPFRLL